MQTTITVRHTEISDVLRERALTVVERLGNIATRPIEAAVVFDAEGPLRTAELRLHVARGEVTVNGEALAPGDGAAVSDERAIDLTASSAAEVLVFDLA